MKQMRYVEDDSTIFWATGADSSAIARRAEFCGKEVEMTVPFEGINSGEVGMMITRYVSFIAREFYTSYFFVNLCSCFY